METGMKYIVASIAAAAFMAAGYYMPVETFLGLFAGGLFLIPASFFIYMTYKLAK